MWVMTRVKTGGRSRPFLTLESGELNEFPQWVEQQTRNAAKQDHGKSQQYEDDLRQRWDLKRGCIRIRRSNVDLFQHPQIVVKRYRAHGDRENDQPKQAEVRRAGIDGLCEY